MPPDKECIGESGCLCMNGYSEEYVKKTWLQRSSGQKKFYVDERNHKKRLASAMEYYMLISQMNFGTKSFSRTKLNTNCSAGRIGVWRKKLRIGAQETNSHSETWWRFCANVWGYECYECWWVVFHGWYNEPLGLHRHPPNLSSTECNKNRPWR